MSVYVHVSAHEFPVNACNAAHTDIGAAIDAETEMHTVTQRETETAA